jgi:peroxiredoxin
MKKLLSGILLLLCVATTNLRAQERKNESPCFSIKADLNEPMPDSVVVLFFKGIVNGNYGREIIRINKTSSDGTFKFFLSGNQPLSPFTLQFFYNKEVVRKCDIYYAEPSDRIIISVKKGKDNGDHYIGGLIFSGIGTEKYRVGNLLYQIKADISKRLSDHLPDQYVRGKGWKLESPDYYKTIEFKNLLNDLNKYVGNGMKRAQDTLFKYEKQLGKNITNFYHYEFTCYSDFRYWIQQLFKHANTEVSKQMIADFYFSKVIFLRPPMPKSSLFKYAVQYKYQLSIDMMDETNFKTKGKGYPFYVQYNAIKEAKNAALRDNMITNLFKVPGYQKYINNTGSRDSCLNDALGIVKDPELRAVLEHQRLFGKGAKMYDFSFQDTAGNPVTLADLKGKVFIIDFYYYGCAPCASFAKRFEKDVYPEFANNPDFKVLSVNTDQTKESWLKAISSGKFTQPSSINLCTGVAFNHPIFKKYEIQSFPWVLLIDKNGRIAEFNLQAKGTLLIKEMIRTAFNEQVSK